jgi:drug/metabolite transporter (DMT)-like permease
VAAVCVATIPLFTPVAAYFFFQEKLRAMNFAGIAVSIVGVVMVVMKEDLTIAVSIKGILFLCLAVGAAIAYSVMVLTLSQQHSPITLVTWQNTFGTLYFLIPFLLFEWHHFSSAQPSASVLTSLVMLAVFSSSAAFMLFIFGVKRIGISRANTFSNMIPVFTALFAFLILGETMIPLNLAGIGLVIGGLFLAQLKAPSANKS